MIAAFRSSGAKESKMTEETRTTKVEAIRKTLHQYRTKNALRRAIAIVDVSYGTDCLKGPAVWIWLHTTEPAVNDFFWTSAKKTEIREDIISLVSQIVSLPDFHVYVRFSRYAA